MVNLEITRGQRALFRGPPVKDIEIQGD